MTTSWIDAGPITIEAATTNPTKASSIQVDQWTYVRIGDTMIATIEFEQSGGTGSAGSGRYVLKLPNSLTVNTGKLGIGPNGNHGNQTLGYGTYLGDQMGHMTAYYNTESGGGLSWNMFPEGSGTRNDWSSSNNDLAGGLRFSAQLTIPISQWVENSTTVTVADTTAKTRQVGQSELNIDAVTSGGETINDAVGYAWRDSDNQYWLRARFRATGLDNEVTHNFTMDGLSLDSAGAFESGCYGNGNGNTITNDCRLDDDNNHISFTFNTAVPDVYVNVDTPVNAKPPWWDANVENSKDCSVEILNASNGVPGLLKDYEEWSGNLDGGFSGGSLKLTRIGRTVTVFIDSPTFGSTGQIDTTSGFIPDRFRPTNRAELPVTVYYGGNVGTSPYIEPSGLLRWENISNAFGQTSTSALSGKDYHGVYTLD